jgi:hypothetical protein
MLGGDVDCADVEWNTRKGPRRFVVYGGVISWQLPATSHAVGAPGVGRRGGFAAIGAQFLPLCSPSPLRMGTEGASGVRWMGLPALAPGALGREAVDGVTGPRDGGLEKREKEVALCRTPGGWLRSTGGCSTHER